MIRACTMKYENSAHLLVFGTHKLNKVTFSPLGCKFIIHNNKFICGSWSDRNIKVFYIGNSHEYYHCYTCLNISTNGKCVTNTFEIFENCVITKTSSLSRIIMLLDNLRYAFKNQITHKINHQEVTDHNNSIVTPKRFTNSINDINDTKDLHVVNIVYKFPLATAKRSNYVSQNILSSTNTINHCKNHIQGNVTMGSKKLNNDVGINPSFNNRYWKPHRKHFIGNRIRIDGFEDTVTEYYDNELFII